MFIIKRGGIVEIDYYVFDACTSLSNINLPEGLKTIRENAFRGCTSLEKITIPESVEFIDDNAFNGCNKLTIYCVENSYAHRYAVQKGVQFQLI